MARDAKDDPAVLDSTTLGEIAFTAKRIESLMRECGAVGNTLGELYYSRKTHWPLSVRRNVHLVLKVRNGAIHDDDKCPPPTVDELKRFRPASRRVIAELEALGPDQLGAGSSRPPLAEGHDGRQARSAGTSSAKSPGLESNRERVARAVEEIRQLLVSAGGTGRSLSELAESRPWPRPVAANLVILIRVSNQCFISGSSLRQSDLISFEGATSVLKANLNAMIEGRPGSVPEPVAHAEGDSFASRAAAAAASRRQAEKQSLFVDSPDDGWFERSAKTIGRWCESDSPYVRAAGTAAGIGAAALALGGAIFAVKVVKDDWS